MSDRKEKLKKENEVSVTIERPLAPDNYFPSSALGRLEAIGKENTNTSHIILTEPSKPNSRLISF